MTRRRAGRLPCNQGRARGRLAVEGDSQSACRIKRLDVRGGRQQEERTWKDSADFFPLVKDWLDWWDPDSTVIGSTLLKACAGRVLAYCSATGKCQSRTSSAGTARQTKDHLRIRHRLLGPFDNVSLEHMIQASARPGHRQQRQQERPPKHSEQQQK